MVLAVLSTLIALSTLAGAFAAAGDARLNPNAFGPFIRIAVCFFGVASADDPSRVQRRLLWLGCLASVFAVMQYFSPTVAEFTSLHYLAPERSAVFSEEFGADILVRVIGVYENPSSVALMSLVLILVSVHSYRRGLLGGTVLAIFVAAHAAAGVLSLSKIFFAGLPILLLQLVLYRYWKALALAFVAILALGIALYSLEHPLFDVVRYAIDSAVDPDAALKGRYLAEQSHVIEQSWLFGYGALSIEGVTINDSAYLTSASLIGVLGIFVLGLMVAIGLARMRAADGAILYLVLATLGLAAVGANSVLGFRVDVLIACLCGVLWAGTRRPSTC
jgi:hypothetical protein